MIEKFINLFKTGSRDIPMKQCQIMSFGPFYARENINETCVPPLPVTEGQMFCAHVLYTGC